MDWARTLLNAKNYLIRENLIGSSIYLPTFYDFSKRCFFHLRDLSRSDAVAAIESDIALFESYGFSGVVLRSLARLQGVVVQA
jgi:hypothetical protein